jgi:hypothetical protein
MIKEKTQINKITSKKRADNNKYQGNSGNDGGLL